MTKQQFDVFRRSNTYVVIAQGLENPSEKLGISIQASQKVKDSTPISGLTLRFAVLSSDEKFESRLKVFTSRDGAKYEYIPKSGEKIYCPGFGLNKIFIPLYNASVPPFVLAQRVMRDDVLPALEGSIGEAISAEGFVLIEDLLAVFSEIFKTPALDEVEKYFCFKPLVIKKNSPAGASKGPEDETS